MIESYNKCYIVGKVVNIEKNETKKGYPVHRLMVETKYKDTTNTIPCSFYGSLSNQADKHINIGDTILIIGRLTWYTSGNKKISGVTVENFSLLKDEF